MVFAFLFLIPVLVELMAFLFWSRKITLKEFSIEVMAQALVAGIIVGVIHYKNVGDTEIWNGTVRNKAREQVSCSHSYPCNCCSVSCGKDCSTVVCSTCYEHPYDVDWAVYTTNDERIEIDRINSQGTNEPPRYASTIVGEPTSVVHRFVNYIKAAPDTLFRHQGLLEKFQSSLPSYPQNVYDYYRLDRLVLVNGVSVLNSSEWNRRLAELNGKLGRKKECNIVAVFVKNLPEDYYYALEQSWVGGKKNDIVVVTDVDDSGRIQWVDIMAWSKNELFKVKLRDDIMNLETLDQAGYFQAVENDVSAYFWRKPMSDFEYLKSSIVPSKMEWIVSMIISLIVAVGMCVLFYRVDINNIES